MSDSSAAISKLQPREPLVAVLLAACAGIVADRFYPLPAPLWWLAALCAWLVWYGAWRRGRWTASAASLLVSVAALAGAWHHCRWSLFAADELSSLATAQPQPVCLEAVVLSGPRVAPAPPYDPLRAVQVGDRTRLVLEAVAVRDDDRWLPAAGEFLALVQGHLIGPRVGDRLRVFGQLSTPSPPRNPGEFDFAVQARRERRLCLVRSGFPEGLTRSRRGSAWSPRAVVDALRATGHEQLHRYIAPEQAGLASAMFLGLREELDEDASQAFLETGTIHLLVISGLNVGILAMCLLALLRWGFLRPRGTRWAIAAVTVLYAVVTDAQPPVVRATIMVVVLCVGRAVGRQTLGLNTLAAAALAVLAISPAELFSTGTQLSFLAVAAIVCTRRQTEARKNVDPLDRLIAQSRPWLQRQGRMVLGVVGRATLVSTVIWLAVLPLTMARFHLVSPAAIGLGILLSPPVTLAMATGFGVLILGNFAPPLAALLGDVCQWNLAVLSQTVERARQVPGSFFWTSGPQEWWLVGCYALVVAWIVAPRFRPPARWCAALLGAWIAVGAGVGWAGQLRRDELRCTFLAVGHGCCAVLELPGGETLLYDAGRLGSPIAGSRTIAGYLWSRGITRVDAVVLSHSDLDHYNALPRLVRQFSIGTAYVSPVMFENPRGAVGVLQESLRAAGVPVSQIWSGDRLRNRANVRIEVLHPPRAGVLGSDNANSVVLLVEHQGKRLLLTGDLESPGLDDLLAEEPIDCDVLLAPHHGSRNSDPPGMAAWSRPDWVVVSGGGDEPNTAAATYRRRGGRVLSTATGGALRIRFAAGQVFAENWLGEWTGNDKSRASRGDPAL